jgi:hypothetical protein
MKIGKRDARQGDGELREGQTAITETITPPAVAPNPQQVVSPVSPLATAEPETMDDENIPEPTAAESAQQSSEYRASARRLDDMLLKANPGQSIPPAMNFDRMVQSLYMTAAVQMGAGTGPNEQPRIDIVGARQSIDMLIVLEEKTRGNITEQEKRLLQNALFDLRMSFLEITNAIASSAQRPPQAGKIH